MGAKAKPADEGQPGGPGQKASIAQTRAWMDAAPATQAALTAQTAAPVLETTGCAAILEGVSEGVYVTDRERTILYWNQACEEITGYPAERAVGTRCSDNLLVHVDASGHYLCTDSCPMAGALEDGEPREAEVFLHHRDGHRVPVRVRARALRGADGGIVAAVETFHEISDKVAALEQVRHLEELAYLDALTGLANRRFLQATIEARIAERGRYGWPFGIIMMDVDHFKSVNDTYGHEVGDKVLQTVARTLRSATRSYDVVGRWGGEEFLAVVANATDDDLASVAERYRALVESSDVPLDGMSLRVTISAGAAVAQDTDDASSAVERADRLLYMSKANGRNRVTVGQTGGEGD